MPSTPKRQSSTGRGSQDRPQVAEPEQTPAPQEASPPAQERPVEPPRPQRLNITDLKDMSIQKLTQIAKHATVSAA